MTLKLKNVNSLQIASVISVMSFALGASRFQHEYLTQYEDPNSRLQVEFRSFLGLCTIFSFIPNFARFTARLIEKLCEGQPQIFDGITDDEFSALERIKVKLVEPPVLAPPRLIGDYTVDTDACGQWIGFLATEAT